MLDYLFDIGFVLIVVVTAWFVARRMLIDSALTCLAMLLSVLVAMTTFESVVDWIRRALFAPTDIGVTKYLWFFFALAIFSLTFVFLMWSFSRVLDGSSHLGNAAESVGCWIVGGVSGYLLAAFLLTIVQTLPAPRDFGGAFVPEAHRRAGPVMALAPDYQLLTLVEYTCAARSPVTGAPWQLRGPIAATDLNQGRWSSYPIRYALWREWLAEEREVFDEDGEYGNGDEGDGSSGSDDESDGPKTERGIVLPIE